MIIFYFVGSRNIPFILLQKTFLHSSIWFFLEPSSLDHMVSWHLQIKVVDASEHSLTTEVTSEILVPTVCFIYRPTFISLTLKCVQQDVFCMPSNSQTFMPFPTIITSFSPLWESFSVLHLWISAAFLSSSFSYSWFLSFCIRSLEILESWLLFRETWESLE